MSPRSAEGFAAPSYSTSARRPHCEGQPKTYWKPSRLELLSCRDSYCSNSQAQPTATVRKVHGQLVEEIMVELVKDVLTGKEDQRDICSIGLKTVVLEMPQTMALSAVRHLAPKLVEGLSSQTLEVKLECMDILNDTLKRFGSQLKEDESDRCLGALFVELGSPRPASRKARRARNLPCLLYTSPSPRDRTRSRMPSSA